MIFTFNTAMMMVLSFTSIILGLVVLEPAHTIYIGWNNADQELRYDLEKKFYLVYSVVLIILLIRIISVPSYFVTMQLLVPMIPGAMCLWGVFNAQPMFCWSALFLKFFLPLIYTGWMILAAINNQSKRNLLIRNLMLLYLFIFPFLFIDCIIDLGIFIRLNPVQVNCCMSGIDAWPRPLPPQIGGVSGQYFVLLIFLITSATYIITLHRASFRKMFALLARLISILFIFVFLISITEVFTPLILKTPFHYCPFCLFYNKPISILFIILGWIAVSGPWWTLLIEKFSKINGIEDIYQIEKMYRFNIWKLSFYSIIFGTITISLETILSLII